MRIKDITIDDVRAGKNWRVLDMEVIIDSPMEDLEIEALSEYSPSDTLVYAGVTVFLRDFGEPGSLNRLNGQTRLLEDCQFPPEDPKDLAPGMTPIVRPLVMVKEVQESGWDYCEYVDGRWRQLGLKPNPDCPLCEEYFANPVEEDPEFNVCGDGLPIRVRHRKGFLNWVKYLEP
jgi:hypothetical protein